MHSNRPKPHHDITRHCITGDAVIEHSNEHRTQHVSCRHSHRAGEDTGLTLERIWMAMVPSQCMTPGREVSSRAWGVAAGPSDMAGDNLPPWALCLRVQAVDLSVAPDAWSVVCLHVAL